MQCSNDRNLDSEHQEALRHSASAGLTGGRSHAKIWMQGLQKCWAGREVQQPPSPEPSLGLSLCWSPRKHWHSPAKSKQDSAAVPSNKHHLPHHQGRAAMLVTKRFLMLFRSAPAPLILLHQHHQELESTLWEMPAYSAATRMMHDGDDALEDHAQRNNSLCAIFV